MTQNYPQEGQNWFQDNGFNSPCQPSPDLNPIENSRSLEKKLESMTVTYGMIELWRGRGGMEQD